MSEKRGFHRVPEHVKVNYRIISLGEDPGDFIDLRGNGQTENISEGGMLFEVHESIPEGTFMEIQFDIPQLDYPLFLRGRVIRVEELVEGKKYDIGIMFTHYFEKDRELLQRHLKDVADNFLEFS
jgi:hypothetical protein